ncbi:unnamed protein product [Paramecium sonneborni]|uniref:Transmembrane protein n=1 Tax=Paramecium sonneborni TaxID=65129 RepID=A0A8S1QWH8_9CILI|nr:unnamed protein product [Paramecium sonneborni]
MQGCVSQELHQNQVKDMKRKHLISKLWEIVYKMQRKEEKKDKQNENQISEFSLNINLGALSCFSELCTELACNNKICEVNLSRCNINIYFAIELANLVQKNTNIQVLQLAGCNLNSFSLSCIFKSMIDHTGLTHLNLSNNKGFTVTSVEDFCKYVLKGKNPLYEINLSFCNIHSWLSPILQNLKHLKSLKRFLISYVNFNYSESESISALRSAIINYTGNKCLDYLDISWNQIGNSGLELLKDVKYISVRQINIKSLNLEYNQLTQDCIESLEIILLKLNIEEIILSHNKLSEFSDKEVLNKKIKRVDLRNNRFEEIPTNFFLNVLSLNLSYNSIKTKGAYQISQVISSKKVMWMELNLNNNDIRTSGFISLIYALIENQKLLTLSVADNYICGEGILVYLFNHELLSLQYLDLSFNYLRYDLVYALISMMKECKLRTLVLSKLRQDENDIPSGRKELIEIKCTNLRELDFSRNNCMIQSILNSLSKQFNRIEYLNLNNCQINQTDLINSLSTFLSHTSTLQTLLLARNDLGDMKVKNFTTLNEAFSKNQSIMYLDLSSNKLKTKIIYLIPGLSKCRSLKQLNISNNLIYETKKIISDFPKLLFSPYLQYIDISKNQIKGQTLQAARLKYLKTCRNFPQIKMQKQQFTADDLHIITKIISESYSIKKLELQDNYSIEFMNNVMQYGNVKVESISINKILFRQDSFQNLLTTIQDNYRNIKFLEISNTCLFQDQLADLLNSIKLIKNLIVLILDYQTFKEKDQRVMDSLNDCLECFRNLKYFSVTKSALSWQFFVFVSKLLRRSTRLIELDLSGNTIKDDEFQLLCDGLLTNQSVSTLHLKNCKLNDDTILQLIPCLHQHSSIKNIDLSENEISFNIFEQFEHELGGQKSSIQNLKLQNLQIPWEIVEIKNQQIINNFLKYLQHIDLSNNSENKIIENIDLFYNSEKKTNIICMLNHLIQLRMLENIQSLTLNNCNIKDNQCEPLANLVEFNQYIKEISLIQNELTWKGFKLIFNPILQNKSVLIKLNLSNNKIDEQYFKDMTSENIIPLRHFRLLIIDGNQFKEYVSGISLLLEKNPRLYIYNNWENVTEAFAIQIVNQYVLFANECNLTKEVPLYLKSLIITKTRLSDQFFIWFGSQYFRFPYLELIDFSDSTKYMSSLSKMHMYINIINENFVNYNIIKVCYNQDQACQPNQFDDGLFKYWLLRFKVYLQNRNLNSLSKIGSMTNLIEQVKWGKFGKFLVHLINKTLNIISSLSYDFRYSSSLHSYARKSQMKIKFYMIGCSIVEIIKIVLGMGVLQKRIKINNHLIECGTISKQCFQNDLHIGFFAETSFFIFMVIAQAFGSLILAIKIRQKATPDYCIQTTEMIRFQRYQFVHKNELLLCFLQLIISFTYFLECTIIGANFEILDFIKENEQNNLIKLKNNIIIVLSFMIGFVFLKAIFQIYISFKSLILFLYTPNSDSASFLQSCMLKVQLDLMLNIEQVLRNFSPQSGRYIRGSLWNYKQIVQSIHGFIDFAILIQIIILRKFRKDFLYQNRVSNMFTSTDIITIIYYIITFIKILMHLSFALFSRPPQLKLSDLNESLLLRRYEKIGSSLQIVQQKSKKEQQQSSQLSMDKKSRQDSKAESIVKTKSEGTFAIKKNSFQQFDEEIDFIQENIQVPMDPLKVKSMKSIYSSP